VREVDPRAVKRIYESRLRGSLLRKLVADMSIEVQRRTNFAESVAEYPQEFVQEVAAAALQVATTGGWDKIAKDLSDYAKK
jgi:hypothetical protein